MSGIGAGRVYDVALSFAEEDRPYVARVAAALKDKGVRVFYDEDERHTTWGTNLYDHLQRVYGEQTQYVVMFVSKDYARKVWTKHERQSAQQWALEQQEAFILPARFDDTDLPGLLKTTAYIDLRGMEPEEFARLIIRKLESAGVRTDGPDGDRSPAFGSEPGVRGPAARSGPTRTRDTGVARSSGSRMKRWLVIGAITAVIIAAAVLGYRSLSVLPIHADRSVRPLPVVTVPASIAVLNFRNDSKRPDMEWLSIAIPEMLSADLAASGKLKVVPREDVVRMHSDLALGDEEEIPADVLQRIRETLHVESLITGSFKPMGDQGSGLLQVAIRVINTSDGRPTKNGTSTGADRAIFGLVTSAARQAGFDALSPPEALAAEALFPASAQATRLYTEGLTRLRRGEARDARPLLLQAIKLEPGFPLAHAALSETSSRLGNDQEAIAEAGKGVELSRQGGLGAEQQLQLQARAHAVNHDWDKVVGVARQLSSSFPESLEYGLKLVGAQISNFQYREALVTLGTLRRRLPPPLSADLRLDLLEAEAHQDLTEARDQKTFAIKAAAQARRLGARSFLARARMLEAYARRALSEDADAERAVAEARVLYGKLGDRGNEARAIELMAQAQDGKDFDAELRLLNEALAIHEQLSDRESVARVLVNVGTTLVWQGHSDDAAKKFDESLQIFRKVHDKYSEAGTLNEIGARLFDLGDLAGAEARYKEALPIFENLKDRANAAATKANLAEVFEWQGNLEQARAMFADALADDRIGGEKDDIAYDQFRLGEIFSLMGDMVAARARYQDALQLWTEAGKPMSAADARVALASLAIEQGNAAGTEQGLRDAEEILRTGGESDRSLMSLGVIAECLLAQGKQAEAADAANQMNERTRRSKNYRVRLALTIIAARIQAATKKSDDVTRALQALEAARVAASRKHLAISELEARLASGEIEVAAGHPEGKGHLAALAAEAKASGFGRIARRAAAAS